MAVTQYIGARYVPKFFENADGTSAWAAGVAYEPLTIVTYNGNSYTSKKPVPASVGNPSANNAYWAPTGIYNEQVESLRQEFEELAENTETSLLEKMNKDGFEHIVMISDSYGVNSAVGGTSWIQHVINNYPDRVAKYGAFGGAGFGYSSLATGYFATYINTMEADETADLVILLAGANDGNLLTNGTTNEATIANGIQDSMNVIRSKYPKAIVKIGFVGSHVPTDSKTSYKKVRDVYRSAAAANGYDYIFNAEYVLHDTRLITGAGIHPGTEGSLKLYYLARNVIFNVPTEVHEVWKPNALTEVEINNDITEYRYTASGNFAQLALTGTPTAFTDPVALAEFGNSSGIFNPVSTVTGSENVGLRKASDQSTLGASIQWSGNAAGKLCYQFTNIAGGGGGVDACDRIYIPKYFALRCDSMLC